MKYPHDVIRGPVVSEKSFDLIESNNIYSFLVDPRANKTEIRQSVEAIFEVEVLSVNTYNRRGKLKRTGRTLGKRKNTKRALVKLAEDDSIDLFGV